MTVTMPTTLGQVGVWDTHPIDGHSLNFGLQLVPRGPKMGPR